MRYCPPPKVCRGPKKCTNCKNVKRGMLDYGGHIFKTKSTLDNLKKGFQQMEHLLNELEKNFKGNKAFENFKELVKKSIKELKRISLSDTKSKKATRKTASGEDVIYLNTIKTISTTEETK